jgi:Domain of unknown function (DUF4168)
MKRRAFSETVSVMRGRALVAAVLSAAGLVVACQQVPLEAIDMRPPPDPQDWVRDDGPVRVVRRAPRDAQRPPQAEVERRAQFSDSDLKSYVRAGRAVLAVESRWRRRLQVVNDPLRNAELRRRVRGEMIEAVKAAGMSVSMYSRINQAERSNQRVRDIIARYRRTAR